MNRKFIVKLGTLTGNNGKTYQIGDEIFDVNLPVNRFEALLKKGRIVEVFDNSIDPNRKIKLAIVTSIWKRPEVFRYFCIGIEKLIDECQDFEISLIVSGSEQNEGRLVTHKEIDSYIHFLSFNYDIKTKYIEIPNEPLAAKVNATTYACKNLDVHYVLCMGSDDIISPELLNEYAKHMRKGVDFIGVNDCYFYDTVSKKSIYWGGYTETSRKGASLGAFRCLSASLLSQLDWMPWEYSKTHRLDSTMMNKLKKIQYSKHVFSMNQLGMFAVDIKSETNITKFKLWNNSQFIDSKVLLEKFPYIK